jgi:hypothetical protein
VASPEGVVDHDDIDDRSEQAAASMTVSGPYLPVTAMRTARCVPQA